MRSHCERKVPNHWNGDQVPRFFYSDDPRFCENLSTLQILSESPPSKILPVFETGPVPHYPRDYICMAFRWDKGIMYTRKLTLLDPDDGFWIILTDWEMASFEEARHYSKQLLHMSFPQIVPYEPLSESS